MNYYIATELDRLLKIRRHKSVVAYDLGTARMSHFGYRPKIGNGHYRVRRCLDRNHFCIALKRALQTRSVRRIGKIEFDSVASKDAAKEAVRSAVSVITKDDVVPGLDEF